MKNLRPALVLTAALALGGAVSAVHADAIAQPLNPTTLSASTFNSDFSPVATTPAMTSTFQLFGAAGATGIVESQVFQGNSGTAYAGEFAYAYQIGVNTGATQSTGDPAHVDGASFLFNATPTGSLVVTDGQVGSLNLPQASPGGMIQSPTQLSWQADTNSGTVRATFQDTAAGSPPLSPGANSATFVLLSTQSPTLQTPVSLLSSVPVAGAPLVYTATGGSIAPIPAPEPTTILAWAGMAGAAVLVRRVRKNRIATA